MKRTRRVPKSTTLLGLVILLAAVASTVPAAAQVISPRDVPALKEVSLAPGETEVMTFRPTTAVRDPNFWLHFHTQAHVHIQQHLIAWSHLFSLQYWHLHAQRLLPFDNDPNRMTTVTNLSADEAVSFNVNTTMDPDAGLDFTLAPGGSLNIPVEGPLSDENFACATCPPSIRTYDLWVTLYQFAWLEIRHYSAVHYHFFKNEWWHFDTTGLSVGTEEGFAAGSYIIEITNGGSKAAKFSYDSNLLQASTSERMPASPNP